MTSRLFLIGIVAGMAAALGLAGLFSALSTQSAAQMMGGNHMGMMGNNMMTGVGQSSVQQAPWPSTYQASFAANGFSNVPNVQVTGITISGSKQVTANLRYTGNSTSPNVVVIASSDGTGMMGGYGGMGMMGGLHSGMMDMIGRGTVGNMPMTGYGMYGQQYPIWNNTQWQQWHTQMAQWHGQMNNAHWQDMQGWHNQMMTNPSMMGQGMMYGSQLPMWGTWNATGSTPTWWQQQPSLTGSMVLNAGWNADMTARITLVGEGSAFNTDSVSIMVFPLTS